ncbi:MAG: GIY-YIG nuclease family protein [Candidatus Vogelbacteria bacterium]|nr:GIY-YIG nuclease family protein [Candidatus Vogelbacteria bacterium]
MAYVYLIKSLSANWVYVGSTSNLEQRLRQHNGGEVRSTKYRAPYKLIHSEEYGTLREARAREKQIKSVRRIKEQILRDKLALSSNG